MDALTPFQQQMLDYAGAGVAMLGTAAVMIAITAASVLIKVVWQR